MQGSKGSGFTGGDLALSLLSRTRRVGVEHTRSDLATNGWQRRKGEGGNCILVFMSLRLVCCVAVGGTAE
jgi:hypothetical protein